jgi:hypothetical protein
MCNIVLPLFSSRYRSNRCQKPRFNTIRIVSKCIANNIKNYIKFHMSVGERQVMYDFYDIKEFPLVLGTVDGTLIPIKAPSVDEHLYDIVKLS